MMIDEFVSHIEYEKRYSKHTIIAYKKDLEQFKSFLSQEYEVAEPADIKSAYIRSFLVELIEQGISSRSVNRKISTLKSYFKYLIRLGLLNQNPMDKIIAPKSAKKLPVFIEKKQMNQFFNNFVFADNYEGILDRAILETFYSTGIRLSELIELQSKNVDMIRNQIKVLGKRNKERIVPIGKELAYILNIYDEAKRLQGIDSLTFFVNHKSNKLYPRYVYRKVNQYLSAVSTVEKRSPHVLRHAFATHMLNNGADLNAIKELLGHSSLAATQVYTHNSIDKLKAVYNQAHPKA